MLKSFEYFAQCLTDPFFEVFEILDDNKHNQFDNLTEDLAGLDKDQVEEYAEKYRIDQRLRATDNHDEKKRAWFLVDLLHKTISRKRIEALLSSEDRPLPYNSDNLRDLVLDEHKLVKVSQFNDTFGGLILNNYAYEICPSTASNSSYWTMLELFRIRRLLKIDFKIRLNPFIEKNLEDYSPMGFKMDIYGRPLDWDRIRALRNEDHGQWLDEYGKTGRTDYVWRPERHEIHFTCEELPLEDEWQFRGSRYFHAIFNRVSGNIVHCDGAIRVYNEYEFNQRMQHHVRNAEVRKIGNRVKIFQVDSDLPQEHFSKLVCSFFVWNQDVQRYFTEG